MFNVEPIIVGKQYIHFEYSDILILKNDKKTQVLIYIKCF